MGDFEGGAFVLIWGFWLKYLCPSDLFVPFVLNLRAFEMVRNLAALCQGSWHVLCGGSCQPLGTQARRHPSTPDRQGGGAEPRCRLRPVPPVLTVALNGPVALYAK